MFRKFSINYRQQKRKNEEMAKDNEGKSTMICLKESTSHALNQDIARNMVAFGFNIDQIMTAWKIYKFQTLDEAVTVMMRDESGKFVHKFTLDKNNNKCMICSYPVYDHLYLDDVPLNEKAVRPEDVSLNVSPISPISQNSSRVNKPLLNEQIDISNIVPQEILDDFDDPMICRICFTNTISSKKKTFSCMHDFCNQCVTKYLTTNIESGKVLAIRCLYGGCQRIFTSNEIKAYVSPESYQKYLKFFSRQVKLSGEDGMISYNCPFPDCDDIVTIHPLSTETSLECTNHHRFCSKCKTLGWHNKNLCSNYGNALLSQLQKENKGSLEKYKQCPKCRVIIEKTEGCNEMRCIACNFIFCWLCGKPIEDDHYALYNFRGCPGMKYRIKEKNTCMKNKCVKCLCLFGSCILCIFAVILIIIFYLLFGCPYELVKCYMQKSNDEDSEENAEAAVSNIEEYRECGKSEVIISIFLVLLGLVLQPFYLLFYILYALMECYRRIGCWIWVL